MNILGFSCKEKKSQTEQNTTAEHQYRPTREFVMNVYVLPLPAPKTLQKLYMNKSSYLQCGIKMIFLSFCSISMIF